MEKETIKTISLEDFKSNERILDYVDENFAIINSMEEIPHINEPIRLNSFIIATCIEGFAQLDINYKTYKMQEGDLLFIVPNSIISHSLISPRHKIKIAAFSTQFLQRIIKMEKKVWNIALHIHNTPLRHVGKGEEYGTIFKLYRDLLLAKIGDTTHSYHKEVMQHLVAALFCELLGQLDKEIAESEEEEPKENTTQVNRLLRRFMELLAKDNGMHRSVSYYANELCYSPKHLSKVVKMQCGKTPMELINAHAIECIKYQIKHSDKSIKEIAEEFHFPNQSFFGKYVKAHLGMSPVQYRHSSEE